jgi:hypothetical protein
VVPLLLISGTVGVGKSAVGAEMSEILADREVPHAFVDLDALTYSWPPQGRYNEDLALENLSVVWANFQRAGARRLVVARVVESREDLRRYEEAIPGASVILCRLVASLETREARLRAREMGAGREWHLARTEELEQILQGAALEDFQVVNDERPLRSVAEEVLRQAGWI